MKVLTQTEFDRAVAGLNVGPQTIEIARGVLVDRKPQTEFIKLLGLSRGAVSQAVNRVWEAHQSTAIPQGHEKVSAVLPLHQAYQVKKWAAEAARKGVRGS